MTKDELEKEAEQVRLELEQKERMGIRVQEAVCELLDKALECLDDRDTARSRNEAAFKINMARRRIAQAEDQKRWLAFPIGFWMFAFIGMGAWLIVSESYWPGSKIETGGVFYGSVLWGMVGAAINGLRELHTRLSRQELDFNRLCWYFAHPVIGAGLGGILFLVVSGGLLMTAKDISTFEPSLPLLLAALAGFEQQHVIRYLRDVVRQILRIEEPSPHEGG